MPIYEYACLDCGRSIDVIHGINAPGPTTCQFCGGSMKKQLTAPAIHFKGSGWAKKDARTAAAPAANTTAKKDDAPASDGSTPGPETAPATPAAPAVAPASAPAATTAAAPATGTSGS